MVKIRAFITLALASLAFCLSLEQLPNLCEFKEFKLKFGKHYNINEETKRQKIFTENCMKMIEHNKIADEGGHTSRMGVNKFTDWTLNEIKIMCGFRSDRTLRTDIPEDSDQCQTSNPGQSKVEQPHSVKSKSVTQHQGGIIKRSVSDSVDWRDKGVVTPVKEQGNCGACWAFSAVAAIEGMHALKTKELTSFSEQNLVDCSLPDGLNGCEGGSMDGAFQYVIDNKGIDTEDSYPYSQNNKSCNFKKQGVGASLTGFTNVPSGNESALKLAVEKIGPIAAAIHSTTEQFKNYASGILNDPDCKTEPDHAITVVGYGTENGQDYWLIKNSWGTDWGEKGYFRMVRNMKNHCGVASSASYPTGVKSA